MAKWTVDDPLFYCLWMKRSWGGGRLSTGKRRRVAQTVPCCLSSGGRDAHQSKASLTSSRANGSS